MKIRLLFSLALLSFMTAHAQNNAGIGTITPDPSSILDLTSTDKGILFPRMTGAQRVAISSPAIGLVVYQTDTYGSPPTTPGIYLYQPSFSGGEWKRLARKEEILAATWTSIGNDQYSNNTGSVGVGTNAAPNASSILEVKSTTKGFLFPRMTAAERSAISNPAAGLLVYQTNASGADASGIYFYDGVIWKRIARADEIGGGGGSTGWTVVADDQYSNLPGNVGIGTSTPSSKLHLVGSLLTEGNAITINHPSAILQLQSSSVNKGFLQLSGNNLRIGTNSGNTGGKLIIRMNGADRIAVDSLGQLGIGTTTPLASIHVDQGTFADYTHNGYMLLGKESEINLVLSRTSILARNSGGPATLFLQKDGGVVRLGETSTTATNTKLHITDGTFANYSTANGYMMLGTETGSNMVISNYEILARNNGGAAPLFLQHDGGAVRIGNTGVTASNTRLHITDGTFANYSAENGYMMLGRESTTNLVFSDYEILARDNGGSAPLYLQQDGGAVRIGNTGITASGTRLHITDGAVAGLGAHGYLLMGQTYDENIVMDKNRIQARNNGVGSVLNLQYNGGHLRVGSSNKLYVDDGGNVGINTGNPLAKLDVIGRVRVENDNEAIGVTGNNPYIGLWFNNSYRSKIQQLTDQLYIHSTDKVHLDGDQIAIGDMLNTANSYKLTVTGKIICEELKVELAANWPDYVFAEDYTLTPLSDLKSFIETNNHLPNIPKAAEVEKDGFEVGEMNRKLLEKVEELTLYVIQLQEQIDQLKFESKK